MSGKAGGSNWSREGAIKEGRSTSGHGYLCFVVLARKRVFDVRKLNTSRSHLQRFFIVMEKSTSSQMPSFCLAAARS